LLVLAVVLSVAAAGLAAPSTWLYAARSVTAPASTYSSSGERSLASAPPGLRKAVASSLGLAPGVQVSASFSAAGARLASPNGPWHLAVGLGSIGRAGRSTPVARSEPSHRGTRTLYRSGAVTEWFSTGSGAVEQGFSLSSRPGGHGPLVISLPLSGLSARSATPGVLALQDGTRTVLHYSALRVTDATGSAVPARLEPAGPAVRIVVQDGSARYPLTVDPTWSQQAELTSADGTAQDWFGSSVSLYGTTALVGAPDRGAGSNYQRGAAYVFTESGGTWSQQAELTAADGAAGDFFGCSVSLYGTTALVGAPSHKVGSNSGQGTAYVFTESGGTWSQQAELTAAHGAAGDFFGTSVSLYGTTALVGATWHTVGSNSDQGTAYVLTESGGTWSQQAELTAADGAAGDAFGASVSLYGTTALVGAPQHTVGSNSWQGAAYVFTRPGGTWSQQAELTAADGAAKNFFGSSVSLYGTTALVGAPYSKVGYQGAAYVFTGPGGTWSQQAELTAADGTTDDELGASVSLYGTTALVGAIYHKVGPNSWQGATYVFTGPGGTWSQQAELTAADGAAGDYFGSSVSLYGTTALVGASDRTVGPNSAQGAAYVLGTGAPGPVSVTTAVLPPATAGQAYSAAVSATGGAAPYSWSVVSGSLPPGLALGAASGAITGTASTAGTYDFTVQVTDSSSPAQSAPASLSITVSQGSQAITWTPPASGTVGGSASLSAIGGASGNPVVFSVGSSSGAGVCNVSGPNGTTLDYTATGSCVVDANQAGNADYSVAPTVTETIPVSASIKADQEITFAALANRALAQSPVTVSATASSRLTVSFTTTTPSVCASGGPNGATITLLAAGTCTVQASQAGNATYNAAPAVSRSFTVSKANQRGKRGHHCPGRRRDVHRPGQPGRHRHLQRGTGGHPQLHGPQDLACVAPPQFPLWQCCYPSHGRSLSR
jgi:hypothetical protein